MSTKFIPKIGQYFYSMRGSVYRIYRCNRVDGSCFSGEAIEGSHSTREAAAARVRRLNGWSQQPDKPRM